MLTSNNKKRKNGKNPQRIIQSDEMRRKPSSRTGRPAPRVYIPTFSTILTNHLWLHEREPLPPRSTPPAISRPGLYHTEGVGLSDLLCRAGRCMFKLLPCSHTGYVQFSIHCSLMQLEKELTWNMHADPRRNAEGTTTSPVSTCVPKGFEVWHCKWKRIGTRRWFLILLWREKSTSTCE